jgi:hypothetical protein
MLWTFI